MSVSLFAITSLFHRFGLSGESRAVGAISRSPRQVFSNCLKAKRQPANQKIFCDSFGKSENAASGCANPNQGDIA